MTVETVLSLRRDIRCTTSCLIISTSDVGPTCSTTIA